MTLIKSISGIRGTIGGKPGESLTPLDVVKFAAAYAKWLKKDNEGKLKVVIGRDARPSGPMVSSLVQNTLIACGIDVLDLGLCSTPTVEMAVPAEQAAGGIILTASHNPVQWNALKLLNGRGEFISGEDGAELLAIADQSSFDFAPVQELGVVTKNEGYLDYHIDEIMKLDMVDVEAIRKANFKVAIDGINSVGGVCVPALLNRLGVSEVHELNCEPNGQFAHNPEPLAENLKDIMQFTRDRNCDLAFVVDPDVDRLAMIDENGAMFGEEYTLVSIADYILSNQMGSTVSNLSSTIALREVTRSRGGEYHSAAVGEVNVVKKMKEVNAVIGGEGNGGVIYPALHYGRDALVGIALFLSHLAKSGKKCSELRASYPSYFIAKNKIELTAGLDIDGLLNKVAANHAQKEQNREDGLKILDGDEWVHMRKSNTEPIIRIYSESSDEESANALAQQMIQEINNLTS